MKYIIALILLATAVPVLAVDYTHVTSDALSKEHTQFLKYVSETKGMTQIVNDTALEVWYASVNSTLNIDSPTRHFKNVRVTIWDSNHTFEHPYGVTHWTGGTIVISCETDTFQSWDDIHYRDINPKSFVESIRQTVCRK